MLFNIAGYRYVFSFLENKATENFDAAIDTGNYSDDNLIEIRVPLNMPYQDRLTGFERHYGEVTVEGKVYTYVKMKIDKDVMILKCIPNYIRQQIKNTVNNLARSNSAQDMDNTGKKHNTSFNKVFSSDYDNKNHFCVLPENGSMVKSDYPVHTTAIQEVLMSPPHQPPRC
jgi:hypothetical protein